MYLCPAAAEAVVADLIRLRRKGKARPEPDLSSREREVVQLVARGNTSKRIASLLDLSVRTVETHRARIRAKLKMGSIAELTIYAIREGLVEAEHRNGEELAKNNT